MKRTPNANPEEFVVVLDFGAQESAGECVAPTA